MRSSSQSSALLHLNQLGEQVFLWSMSEYFFPFKGNNSRSIITQGIRTGWDLFSHLNCLFPESNDIWSAFQLCLSASSLMLPLSLLAGMGPTSSRPVELSVSVFINQLWIFVWNQNTQNNPSSSDAIQKTEHLTGAPVLLPISIANHILCQEVSMVVTRKERTSSTKSEALGFLSSLSQSVFPL